MKGAPYLLVAGAVALAWGKAVAMDMPLHLPLAEVVGGHNYAARVGDSVTFVFGATRDGETLGTISSAQRKRNTDNTDEAACQFTLLAALADLRDQAVRQGGDAVVDIVSDYRERPFSSAGEYECHVGSNGVFVTLKGTLMRLRKKP